MLFFVAGDGTITNAYPEKIYQGSVLANSVYLIAPFAEGMLASVAFKLPNGVWTARYPMDSMDKIEGVVNKDTGQPYKGWHLLLDESITKLYGTVTAQFFFYSESGGTVFATSATNFSVYVGVPEILPEKDEPGAYNLVLENISSLQKRLNNGVFAARALHRWSAAFTYGLDEITFVPDAGQFGAFVKSLIEDNEYPPYNEYGGLNSNYWQEVISFDHIADDYFNELKNLAQTTKEAAREFVDYKNKKIVWVQELPEEGDPEKLYAILNQNSNTDADTETEPDTDTDTDQEAETKAESVGVLFDLYVWDNGEWRHLGGVTLEIDLDKFVTVDDKSQIIDGRKIFRSAFHEVCLNDMVGITIQPRVYKYVDPGSEESGEDSEIKDGNAYPFCALSEYDLSFVKSEDERVTFGYTNFGKDDDVFKAEPAITVQTKDGVFELIVTEEGITDLMVKKLDLAYPVGTVHLGDTSPAALVGGNWEEGIYAGKISTTREITNEISVPSRQTVTLHTITIPANCHVTYNATVANQTPSDAIMSAILSVKVGDLSVNDIVRTTSANGGGCTVSVSIPPQDEDYTISVMTYNYNTTSAASFRAYVSATIIENQKGWRRIPDEDI